MGSEAEAIPRWRHFLRMAIAVVGVGPWGALAGGALFWLGADLAGAPHDIESWGLWVALGGAVVGFVASSYRAMRAMDRYPRAATAVVAVAAALVVVSSVAGG
jgi:hypothetical protein